MDKKITKINLRKTSKKILEDVLVTKIRVFVHLKNLLRRLNKVGKRQNKGDKEVDKIEVHQIKTIIREVLSEAIKSVKDGVCKRKHVAQFLSQRFAEYIKLAVAANHRNIMIFRLTKDKDYQNLYRGTVNAIGNLIRIQKALQDNI